MAFPGGKHGMDGLSFKTRVPWRTVGTLVLGSVIQAFGLYNIHSVSGVTEGGVLGLTLLLHRWLGLSPAISGLVFNALCYGLGIKTLGRRFVFCSIVSSGAFSGFYAICELFPPLWPELSDHPLSAALLGALFIGTGAGLGVRMGGASSGDDALAMSLEKLTGIGIRWIYLISDLVVLCLSLTYIPLVRMIYSLITVVLSGQIVGFITGFRRKE